MSSIDPNASLADLVTSRPDLASSFESLGLDYCCGGAQSLTEACSEAGFDVAEVLARLVAEAPVEAPEDWAALDPSGLVDHLEGTHHEYLDEALPRLSALLDRVVGVHGESHPELNDVRATFCELRDDLEPHLLEEENVLFPMIRELCSPERPPDLHAGSLKNPIGVLGVEHDRVGELLARLRAQTSGYRVPADGCASYEALYCGLAELEADTHLHIHKENNLLFPVVIAEETERTSR